MDYLRQAILCSGDTALDTYWNPAYEEIGRDGKKTPSKEFREKTLRERSETSINMWDVVHQCRDMNALANWMEVYKLPKEPAGLLKTSLKVRERHVHDDKACM
jgi:hypothetical protein